MCNFDLDFSITSLGECSFDSPVRMSKVDDDLMANYVGDDQRIIYDIDVNRDVSNLEISQKKCLELAGPREKIFFEPGKARAAIVTCGGLCPGLNDVIRAIVMNLWYQYGVRHIYGIRNGYRGFLSEYVLPVMELKPQKVSDIHNKGGTILGSSRGSGERVSEIVDCLEKMNIDMLFVIGGDGTQRGSLDISNEALKRNMKCAVVGIPKTIDNDLSFVQRSFGFETAVSEAVRAVAAAHVEAQDAIHGVGIVKVMGRQSGFIAAQTALALNDVNFVLIPEVPFEFEGKNGLFINLEKRLRKRNHAVILVAEGAGQELMEASDGKDASGNIVLSDIGLFVKSKIELWFKEKNFETNVKYIDPSYIIRSAPANPNDSVYCTRLGAHAVHAAISGRTGLVISLMHDKFVHVPISMAVAERNNIDPEKELWRDVVEATGQPLIMK